ncbi:HTTM domain-containing protein [Natronolimnohabitans sp. A-GB9]|uniref:HTTM domain-containing protein n=1 Tax=Natronolimnohabitans sp. A-GB9 TaxID=3069757 RepID=UPI0027AE2D9F|nr:HTTM domain-containing protein [Natronolimnohabitans sp. A-GB9]MDQ2049882.1 HTTM domain-containing protein [Natronolimnohabitans sp. A-GB9]
MTGHGRSRSGRSDRVESLLASAHAIVKPRLGIDLRALAAFRIALGFLLLADLLGYRAPGLIDFYTDAGVLPREALAAAYPPFASLSLHAIAGSAWVQALLFVVAAFAAVCLLVGYRMRLATAVSLVLLASLHARNPLLVNGGDTILLSFLFLGLFLPLDARWAIDASQRSDGDQRVCSLATATLLAHFTAIYAVNAVLKYQSDAWMAGDAVSRIFYLEEYIVGLGPFLAEQSTLLAAANWLWVALLTVSVFLVVYTGRPRIALVAAFVAAHLGLAATMRLGIFPFVMIAGLLLFLPPSVWDRIDERVRSLEPLAGQQIWPNVGDRARVGIQPVLESRPKIRRSLRASSAAILVGFLLFIGVWHAATVGVDAPQPDVDEALSEASWAFFAPNPPDASSWYVVAGELESGEAVDTIDGGDISFDRPPDAAETYPTTLWHRYGTELRYADEHHYAAAATTVCERSDRDLEAVRIYRVDQPVDADGPVGDPIADERIEHAC